MARPLQVLSLGAGVQSSTLLLMSCKGELPKLDAAVFADTQWESAAVYAHLEWLEEEAKAAGIPLYRVTGGNLRQHTLEGFVRGQKNEGDRYATLPLYVCTGKGIGRIRRQCTREYKIDPINRFIRTELLGLKPRQRAPRHAIDGWFGISADELRRVRSASEFWRRNIYPLVGLPDPMLPKPYHRDDCEAWLAKHYPGRNVPRSTCLGCPFHRDIEWRQVKRNPDEWADVVEVDRAIRHADGMNGEVFLHRSGLPLEGVDLRADHEKGQGLLFGSDEECLGVCGT